MERRDDDRRPYRIRVYFWDRDTNKRSLGYTTNISTSGMYITTSRLLPRGTRIRVALRSADDRNVAIEAVVARAIRSKLQIQPNGMGVRFLRVDELVSEIIPEIDAKLPREEAPSEKGVYRLRFASREQFLAAYWQDISTGGIFVPTDQPAALDETVTIELQVEGSPPLAFQARVVHRAERGDGNLMAGMGVELMSFDQTLTALKGMAGKSG